MVLEIGCGATGGSGGSCPYTYGWKNAPCQVLSDPLAGANKCTSGFCERRVGNWHAGIDLKFSDGSTTGKPVYAAHNGKVLFSGS
ncbi:MAG: hypothetical protein V1802_02880, partial [Candidatus Aenigmatarchaeota archaeon]